MDIRNKFNIGYWNVGIIQMEIDEIMRGKAYGIQWMAHTYKDRFFADPFLYKTDFQHYYIFAEELIFVKNKGAIVLLTIEKESMKLVKREVVIEQDTHLSYPYFEDNSLVPENYRSGGLYRFYTDKKPLRKEKILDVPLIDPTFVSFGGSDWLFGTTKEKEDDANQKLSIYLKKEGQYFPHKKNPVKIDVNSARPGGKFFYYNNELFRPAQNCRHLYGEDIKLMKIVKLNEMEFEEEEALSIDSHHMEQFNLGLHTFNVQDGFVVVDGFSYYPHMIQKIKNKISGY